MTLHLDRNDGTGREVCREAPVTPTKTTNDIRAFDCPVCRRVLIRCMLDGETSFHWRPRCALCNVYVALHDSAEELLPAMRGAPNDVEPATHSRRKGRTAVNKEMRLICFECYQRRHPNDTKYVPVTRLPAGAQ